MTPATIAVTATAPSAASDAVEAIASAAVARLHDAGAGDGLAFGRVLADETQAATPYAAREHDAGASSRQTARQDRAAVAGSSPDRPRDDDRDPARVHDDRERAGADQAKASSRVRSGDATPTADTGAADGQTPADGTDATGAPTDNPAEAAPADGTGTAGGTVAAGATTSAGKGHHKPGAATDAADAMAAPIAGAAVLAAVVTPATATEPKAADEKADTETKVRNPKAATPAVSATPAATVTDGESPQATPAVPAHAPDAPSPADAFRAATGTSTAVGTISKDRGPTASQAGTTAVATGLATGLSADQPTPSVPSGGSPAATEPGAPATSTAPAAIAVAAAPIEGMVASAQPAGAGPAIAVTRRDVRGRGAAATAGGDATAKAHPGETAAEGTAGLPSAASDIARARASIARITAAHPAATADEHRPDASLEAAAPAVATAQTATSGATPDAALASIAAARGAGTSSSAAPPTTTTATTTTLAADRVAFEAIDRIKTTVTAGVPGLESRIDDPELGTIRIVVSARLGETIRAEIVARDPAAARELASSIDRALASGATLPGNMDLRVRAEGAAPAARPDAHLGSGSGGHPGAQDQASSGAFTDAGGSAPGRDADRDVLSPLPAPTPASDRGRGPGSVPVAASRTTGSVHPGTALDVRA